MALSDYFKNIDTEGLRDKIAISNFVKKYPDLKGIIIIDYGDRLGYCRHCNCLIYSESEMFCILCNNLLIPISNMDIALFQKYIRDLEILDYSDIL